MSFTTVSPPNGSPAGSPQWYFYTPLGGGKDLQLKDDTPPPDLVSFFLILRFTHVYTPQTFVHTHPNFKFLEITLVTLALSIVSRRRSGKRENQLLSQLECEEQA